MSLFCLYVFCDFNFLLYFFSPSSDCLNCVLHRALYINVIVHI